jgi:transposase
LRILIASKPVDFRKGINGLAALVSTALGANPYDVYIFRSKRNDRLKMVVWDGSGMVMVTKVLEDRHFTWPAVRDGAVHLGASELALFENRQSADIASAYVEAWDRGPVWQEGIRSGAAAMSDAGRIALLTSLKAGCKQIGERVTLPF